MTDKNYKQLQALYGEFAESNGLRILAFPCNQFGGQVNSTAHTVWKIIPHLDQLWCIGAWHGRGDKKVCNRKV